MTKIDTMDIKDLAYALEEKIHYKMQDLNILGEASKDLEGKEREKCYMSMAEVFNDLRPVEGYLRYSFPQLNNTFDVLIQLYEDNKTRKKKPSVKRKVVKRVTTHPDDKVSPKEEIYAHLELDSMEGH